MIFYYGDRIEVDAFFFGIQFSVLYFLTLVLLAKETDSCDFDRGAEHEIEVASFVGFNEVKCCKKIFRDEFCLINAK